jgi:hypothetical protein
MHLVQNFIEFFAPPSLWLTDIYCPVYLVVYNLFCMSFCFLIFFICQPHFKNTLKSQKKCKPSLSTEDKNQTNVNQPT